MECKVADFWSYFKKCYRIYHGDSTPFHQDEMLENEITHRPLMLQTGRTNRILFYHGCFNPPHCGHEALLTYAFWNIPDTVAAIVTLVPDAGVEAKCGGSGENPLFHRTQRAKLWRGKHERGWCWIYEHSMGEWSCLENHLARDITRDGFELTYVNLTGPDHVSITRPPRPARWECHEIIVSDIARSAGFKRDDGSLLQLVGYKPWETMPHDEEDVKRHAARMASLAIGELSRGMSLFCPSEVKEISKRDSNWFQRLRDDFVEESASRLAKIRMCRVDYDSEQIMYFIPSESKPMNISATAIREIIKAGPWGELGGKLESMALNSDILVQLRPSWV